MSTRVYGIDRYEGGAVMVEVTVHDDGRLELTSTVVYESAGAESTS